MIQFHLFTSLSDEISTQQLVNIVTDDWQSWGYAPLVPFQLRQSAFFYIMSVFFVFVFFGVDCSIAFIRFP